jgi:hypothetical protein
MAISDRHFPAQIVARGEEPLFFDDIACLRDYIAAHRDVPRDASIYVADHLTTEWVAAPAAVYTLVPGLATPMASGLIAHRDAATRAEDAAAKGGENVPANDVLGPWAVSRGLRGRE